jgi:glucose-1-phosphate adenylyltransferase
MFSKKECVAMLLAGGQGSRLYALTNELAKPGVTFGAKYRIIDFPLSNCINSGIDTVGVLTQYQPLLLNEYIGNGQPWDLDRTFGGVQILPPYQGKTKTDWYKGTANAIFQNITYIKRYNPEYVIVLSGDHIYKMDYSKMIQSHKESGADATIAVIDVPLAEASRFGIMNTDENLKIIDFEEKPKFPKSTKASMGIYIFNTKTLINYLINDENDPLSSNDFGKNIIPKMLSDKLLLYAYEFSGYWKDVGTIYSLWEANMDLLGKNPLFDITDLKWKIYSRTEAYPPQYLCSGALVRNSLITEGSIIEGTVINSILANNVHVKKGAVVENSVIFSNTIIEEDAKAYYSIIDEGVVVGRSSVVGADYTNQKNSKITVVASKIIVGEKTRVAGGEIVERDVIL